MTRRECRASLRPNRANGRQGRPIDKRCPMGGRGLLAFFAEEKRGSRTCWRVKDHLPADQSQGPRLYKTPCGTRTWPSGSLRICREYSPGVGALKQANVRGMSLRRGTEGRRGGGVNSVPREGSGVADVGRLDGCLNRELRALIEAMAAPDWKGGAHMW